MKYLSIVLIALIVSSCCSTKKVTEQSPKLIAQVNTPTIETPEVETKSVEESEINTKIPDEPAPKEDMAKVDIEEKIELPENNLVIEAFNHNSYNSLLKNYVTKTGSVDYNAFKNNSKPLRDYIKSLSESMPKKTWSKEDKLAYWINAYNAMTIDLIIRNYPVKSIKDINKPWDQRLWKLGEKWYNLNEIEHQILRKMNEPRIHFAIVCASFSCPKLQNEAYTAANLEAQLTEATREFLADSKRNTISVNNLKLSKIFKWFAKDFKQDGSLISFINKYTDVTISNKAKTRYRDYNWDLNN